MNSGALASSILPEGTSSDICFIGWGCWGAYGTVNGHVFTFSSQDEAVIEIAGSNPVEIPNGTSLLLQLQISNIFKKMDMSSIAATTNISESNRVSVANPCPTIDSSATDLYTCFRKGIETEANFGRDNGDDELDGSDDTVK